MKQFVLDVFSLKNVLSISYQKELYEIKIKINATSLQDLNILFKVFGLGLENLKYGIVGKLNYLVHILIEILNLMIMYLLVFKAGQTLSSI